MNIQAVIFDMDGVICNTNPHHKIAFEAFFKKYQIFPTDQELADHMYGKNNQYIMNHFFGREITGSELEELTEEKEGLFRQIYQPIVETIPGYIDFLSFLLDREIKVGVATSAPKENRDMILSELEITHHFGSLLASEDVLHHKPEPEVYLKSAQNLKVAPEHCLVFEDSVSGVQAGLNAGMEVVGVLSTYAKDDLPPCKAYIHDFHEMKQFEDWF